MSVLMSGTGNQCYDKCQTMLCAPIQDLFDMGYQEGMLKGKKFHIPTTKRTRNKKGNGTFQDLEDVLGETQEVGKDYLVKDLTVTATNY